MFFSRAILDYTDTFDTGYIDMLPPTNWVFKEFPPLVNVNEMAEMLRVKPDTIYRWAKKWEGFPQPMKNRRPYVWSSKQLLDWINRHDEDSKTLKGA